MALVERIGRIALNPDTGPTKLSIAVLHAQLTELALGHMTRQAIIDYYVGQNADLDASDISDLDWLIGLYQAQPNAAAKERFLLELRIVFILAEAQHPGYVTRTDLVSRLQAI